MTLSLQFKISISLLTIGFIVATMVLKFKLSYKATKIENIVDNVKFDLPLNNTFLKLAGNP